MAPTKSTKGKEVLRTNILAQGKASVTTRPGKSSTIKHQRNASSLAEGGGLPGVQKIKSALRQTRRLLAKVRESALFGRSQSVSSDYSRPYTNFREAMANMTTGEPRCRHSGRNRAQAQVLGG